MKLKSLLLLFLAFMSIESSLKRRLKTKANTIWFIRTNGVIIGIEVDSAIFQTIINSMASALELGLDDNEIKERMKKFTIVWTSEDIEVKYPIPFQDINSFGYHTDNKERICFTYGVYITKCSEIGQKENIPFIQTTFRLFSLYLDAAYSYYNTPDTFRLVNFGNYVLLGERYKGLRTIGAKGYIDKNLPHTYLGGLLGCMKVFYELLGYQIKSNFEDNNSVELTELIKHLRYVNKDNIKILRQILSYNYVGVFLATLDNPEFSFSFFSLPMKFYDLMKGENIGENIPLIKKLIVKPSYNEFIIIKQIISVWETEGAFEDLTSLVENYVGLTSLVGTYDKDKLVGVQEISISEVFDVFIDLPHNILNFLLELGNLDSKESDISKLLGLILNKKAYPWYYETYFSFFLINKNIVNLKAISCEKLADLYTQPNTRPNMAEFCDELLKYDENDFLILKKILMKLNSLKVIYNLYTRFSNDVYNKFEILLQILQEAAVNEETRKLLHKIYKHKDQIEALGVDTTVIEKIAAIYNNQFKLSRYNEILNDSRKLQGELRFKDIFAVPTPDIIQKYKSIIEHHEFDYENQFELLKIALKDENGLFEKFLKLGDFYKWDFERTRIKGYTTLESTIDKQNMIDFCKLINAPGNENLKKSIKNIITQIDVTKITLFNDYYDSIKIKITLADAYELYRTLDGIDYIKLWPQLANIVEYDAVQYLINLENVIRNNQVDSYEKITLITNLINKLSKFFFVSPFILSENKKNDPNLKKVKELKPPKKQIIYSHIKLNINDETIIQGQLLCTSFIENSLMLKIEEANKNFQVGKFGKVGIFIGEATTSKIEHASFDILDIKHTNAKSWSLGGNWSTTIVDGAVDILAENAISLFYLKQHVLDLINKIINGKAIQEENKLINYNFRYIELNFLSKDWVTKIFLNENSEKKYSDLLAIFKYLEHMGIKKINETDASLKKILRHIKENREVIKSVAVYDVLALKILDDEYKFLKGSALANEMLNNLNDAELTILFKPLPKFLDNEEFYQSLFRIPFGIEDLTLLKQIISFGNQANKLAELFRIFDLKTLQNFKEFYNAVNLKPQSELCVLEKILNFSQENKLPGEKFLDELESEKVSLTKYLIQAGKKKDYCGGVISQVKSNLGPLIDRVLKWLSSQNLVLELAWKEGFIFRLFNFEQKLFFKLLFQKERFLESLITLFEDKNINININKLKWFNYFLNGQEGVLTTEGLNGSAKAIYRYSVKENLNNLNQENLSILAKIFSIYKNNFKIEDDQYTRLPLFKIFTIFQRKKNTLNLKFILRRLIRWRMNNTHS
jgi:hypothetical protein